jgi:hypothetical protein
VASRKGRLAEWPGPPLEEEDLLLFLPQSCPPENFLFWTDHRVRESEDERLSGEAESSLWYPLDGGRRSGRRSGHCPRFLLGMRRTRSQTSQGPENGRGRHRLLLRLYRIHERVIKEELRGGVRRDPFRWEEERHLICWMSRSLLRSTALPVEQPSVPGSTAGTGRGFPEPLS